MAVFGAAALSGACGDWPWPMENPADPWRCDPDCESGYRCDDGECIQVCGNGKLDSTELCDGTNLRGKTCEKVGFRAGTLSCGSDCRPDTSACGKTFTPIAAGTFTMGSPATEACRQPGETEHKVTLSNRIEVMTTEVTQGLFKAVMVYNPSLFSSCGSACPVETVNWHEAAAYCNSMSRTLGYAQCYKCSDKALEYVTCEEASSYSGSKVYSCPGYRLPTEAEWEYSYRAGTTTALHSGETITCTAKDPNADKIAWFDANSGLKTSPVGKKAANKWGLYDMAGNVWEWCHDGYKADLGSSPATNPAVGGLKMRVLRGGSWDTSAGDLRAAYRISNYPANHGSKGYYGFRCVRTLP